MNDALATASYWAPILETVADIAFGVVILALAVELVSGRIAKRFERQLDAARELRIAELNNETAQLRKQMGPRRLDGPKFKESLEGKPKAPVEIMFPREDGEAFMLATQFRDVLKISGWQAAEPLPIPPGDVARLINQPSVSSVGGQPTGVTVVVRADTQADFDAFAHPNENTPLNALIGAISQSLGATQAAAAGPNVFHVPAPGVLRIVVGPKP